MKSEESKIIKNEKINIDSIFLDRLLNQMFLKKNPR
jgi:hypothetical protein